MNIRILLLLLCCTTAVRAQQEIEVYEASFPFDSGVVLHFAVAPFDSTVHRLEPCEPDGGHCLINGVPMFGTDYDEPITVVESAALEVEGHRIPLDVSGMTNAWFVRPYQDLFHVESSGPDQPYRWAVRASLSDGAGSYVAVWEVVRGSSVRTMLLDAYSYELCKD